MMWQHVSAVAGSTSCTFSLDATDCLHAAHCPAFGIARNLIFLQLLSAFFVLVLMDNEHIVMRDFTPCIGITAYTEQPTITQVTVGAGIHMIHLTSASEQGV